jgi:N-methylhydantoinase A
VIAASAIAKAAGFEDVITGDLGGTSFDVALVAGGQVALAAQTSIDFGLVIRSPMIEITTIGAGGGSIARVDASGLLEVGPESAGTRPGPACYAQGNERPTLTDANLVLGRIDGEAPIGNLKRLDLERARAAIATHVAEPLGLDVMAAAEAILRVANARMADAIRLVSIERGLDPARFKLMPFGGGGALHAGALIREVGLRGALVPRFPGVTSALGCIIADVRQDQVQTINMLLDRLDLDALDARMVEASTAMGDIVAAAGLDLVDTTIHYELDMHYLGQTHTVRVPLPRTLVAGETRVGVSRDIIQQAFETAYSAAFSRLLPGIPVRIVSLRTTAIGRRPPFDLSALAPGPDASLAKAKRDSRPVWFDGGFQQATRWSRLDLPVGAVIQGPAILEQPDATVLVDPGLTARVDAMGNVILEPQEQR